MSVAYIFRTMCITAVGRRKQQKSCWENRMQFCFEFFDFFDFFWILWVLWDWVMHRCCQSFRIGIALNSGEKNYRVWTIRMHIIIVHFNFCYSTQLLPNAYNISIAYIDINIYVLTVNRTSVHFFLTIKFKIKSRGVVKSGIPQVVYIIHCAVE